MAKFILNSLPFGPRFAEWGKQYLKQTNTDFRCHLPREEIRVFAESRFAEGVDSIFVGHFHQEYIYRNSDSKSLYILPDWFSTQKVTVFDQESKKAGVDAYWVDEHIFEDQQQEDPKAGQYVFCSYK